MSDALAVDAQLVVLRRAFGSWLHNALRQAFRVLARGRGLLQHAPESLIHSAARSLTTQPVASRMVLASAEWQACSNTPIAATGGSTGAHARDAK
eukprot:683112-Prymnesium_polylepis.1